MTISVVDPSGAVIANASVELSTKAGCDKRATTGPDGRASLQLPAGRYDLRIAENSFRTVKRVIVVTEPQVISVTLGDASCTVCIEVDPSSENLNVQVVDTKGQPVPGVRAWFHSPHDDAFNSYVEMGSEGRVSLKMPFPSLYEVTFIKDGFLQHESVITLQRGEEVRLKAILEPGTSCADSTTAETRR